MTNDQIAAAKQEDERNKAKFTYSHFKNEIFNSRKVNEFLIRLKNLQQK